MCLNWKNLFSVFVWKTSDNELNTLLSQEIVETNISIDAKPKTPFLCAPVPFAIKDETVQEIDRLVKEEIYETVSASKWAALIVLKS